MEYSENLISFLNKHKIPYRKTNEGQIDVEVKYIDESLDPIIILTDNFNNY
jgi:hypothetical protein